MTVDEAKKEIEYIMGKWYWNILSTTEAVQKIIEVASGKRTTEGGRPVPVPRD